MFAIGLVLIWARLRSRGRRIVRYGHVRASRHQGRRRTRLKLLRWKQASEPEPEHKIA